MSVADAKIIQVALNGLDNILKLGAAEAKRTSGPNPYAIMIEECYGLDKIEYLQSHENIEIYQKAFHLIETYFGVDDEENLPAVRYLFIIIEFVSLFLLICSKVNLVHLNSVIIQRVQSMDKALKVNFNSEQPSQLLFFFFFFLNMNIIIIFLLLSSSAASFPDTKFFSVSFPLPVMFQ